MSDTSTDDKTSGFSKVYGWVTLVVVILLMGLATLTWMDDGSSTSSSHSSSNGDSGIVLSH